MGPMSRRFLALPFLLATGCGGLGDQCANHNIECRDHTYVLTPKQVAVQPGGTVSFTAINAGTADTISFTVKGGDVHGTVTSENTGTVNQSSRIYTAPSTPGTFQVIATFTKGDRVVSTQTATVIVTTNP